MAGEGILGDACNDYLEKESLLGIEVVDAIVDITVVPGEALFSCSTEVKLGLKPAAVGGLEGRPLGFSFSCLFK